jgi:hypothetical protein
MHVMNEANGPEGGTDWQRVNWRKAERTVRNLRQRLFRAAQQGDLRGVHALQKLLLRSYSNTLVSVRRVTQQNAGKHTPGVDKVVIKTPQARGRLVDLLSTTQLWRAHPARRVYIPSATRSRLDDCSPSPGSDDGTSCPIRSTLGGGAARQRPVPSPLTMYPQPTGWHPTREGTVHLRTSRGAGLEWVTWSA